MKATYNEDERRVRVTGDARQQLYDASGYGRPLGGDAVSLSPVEAAYLLSEGKLTDVDGNGYAAFVGSAVDDAAVLRAYADLRDRGYYLDHDDELLLYGRGDHPANASPETRVAVFDENADVKPASLPSLVGVADDDGDVTYFSVERVEPDGDFQGVPDADVKVDERAGEHVVVSGGGALTDAGYGSERGGTLVLSDAEKAYLTRDRDADDAAVPRVYADLRDRGTRPRTGFKFGSDFRVYETTEDDHASLLVSAVDAGITVPVVELSRYVRLAHGVRKRAVYALVGEGVEYVAVERERP